MAENANGDDSVTDIGEKIKKVLRASDKGMSARDIANKIGSTRGCVNSYLYAHTDEFEKDASYVPLWTIRGTNYYKNAMELDPVILKLQNREGARIFSQKDFDNLADWENGKAYIGDYPYKTESGKTINCDSSSEVLLLEYLEENGLVQDVGGQALNIRYDTAFRTGCSYKPDIVAFLRDGHIAVFEVKPTSAMDNHKNIEKYRSLAKYCEEQGFLYGMIDPAAGFTTFEELRDMPVCTELLVMFEELNDKPHTSKKPYKYFDDTDVEEWYQKYGSGWSKEQFKLHVHSLIIYYDWYSVSKHGFRVYSRPVKLQKIDNGSYSVIDYL